MPTNIKLRIHTQEPSHSNPRNLWRHPKQARYMTQEFKQKKNIIQKTTFTHFQFFLSKNIPHITSYSEPYGITRKPNTSLNNKTKKIQKNKKNKQKSTTKSRRQTLWESPIIILAMSQKLYIINHPPLTYQDFTKKNIFFFKKKTKNRC